MRTCCFLYIKHLFYWQQQGPLTVWALRLVLERGTLVSFSESSWALASSSSVYCTGHLIPVWPTQIWVQIATPPRAHRCIYCGCVCLNRRHCICAVQRFTAVRHNVWLRFRASRGREELTRNTECCRRPQRTRFWKVLCRKHRMRLCANS